MTVGMTGTGLKEFENWFVSLSSGCVLGSGVCWSPDEDGVRP